MSLLQKKSSSRRKSISPTTNRRKIKNTVKRKTVSLVSAKKLPTPKKNKIAVVGTVTHYFPKIRAAVIKVKTGISVGDLIKIKGHTTDFKQEIASIQVDHLAVSCAKKGQEIGVLVDSRVREHDLVYKI